MYGRTFILGRDKINNEKKMHFDEMTNIINILGVIDIFNIWENATSLANLG
jgi:hypothetical protein